MSIVRETASVEADGIVRKATNEGRTLGGEFVISDESTDRMGDVIVQAGWKFDGFEINPIALFNHDSSFPIGTWKNIRREGDRTLGRLELAEAGTSDRIDELRRLVDQDILRAVSVGFRPLKTEPVGKGKSGLRFVESDLLEVSLVSVPANANAIQIAKSLDISDDVISLAFGEHADGGVELHCGTVGEHAIPVNAPTKRHTMTLSKRIKDAQDDLVANRDKLTDLNAAEALDLDAIEELNSRIDDQERALAAMLSSEAKLAGTSVKTTATPSVVRQPLHIGKKDPSGLDLVVRAMTARGAAHFGGKALDSVLDERYPGDNATAFIAKADQTVGSTTVSGWASELVRTAYADFMQALTGVSIYPALRSRGIGLSFDANGTVSIPGRTAGGAAGSFFVEGDPIRVGRVTTAAASMTSRQMGVIVTFTRKLARQSTPSIEGVVRQAILEDTAATLDPILLDAVAESTARPAGLLAGVAAVALGYSGGDHIAVMNDFKALLAPFTAANASDNITVIMNPAQGLAIDFMIGTNGTLGDWFTRVRNRFNLVESTHATAGRLIAIRNSDFVTATGDAPMFDISEQATLHMEDTTPLPIVDAAGVAAAPSRSLFQTASVGVRMIQDISWKMRRTGMVQWIDSVSW